MARREILPLHREHSVTLQVAERAVVRKHVEPVGDRLERTPGLVSPIPALADVRAHDARSLLGRHRADARSQLVVGEIAHRVEHRGDELLFPVGIPVDERHEGAIFGLVVAEELGRQRLHRLPGVTEVVAPRPAARGLLDPLQEDGDDFVKLGQHHRGDVPHLRKR